MGSVAASRVVDEVEGAEDVVGVFESPLWHGALEDDLLRLSSSNSVPSIQFEK